MPVQAMRFPFSNYPKGWFQVAYTREVAESAVDSELFGMGIDVDARYTFFVALDPETGEKTRMGLGFARDFCKQIEQDIPIWEAEMYREKPMLARGESAITEFRNWAVQSYADPEPEMTWYVVGTGS